MTSKDKAVYVEIDGQPYVLRGMQNSSGAVDFQRAVLERLDEIEPRVSGIALQVYDIATEQMLLRQKIDMLKTGICWILAVIGIFLAVIARLNRDKGSAPEKTSPAAITNPPAVDISALAQQVKELLLPDLRAKE